MTFTASSPSPKFWLSLFALAMLVEACSATNTTNEGKHHVAPANSSKFEWGVQHYEAGNYEKAIKVFDGLRKEGAAVPNFDLLAYYLGMSHFRLGHFDVAARELEAFVHASGGRLEAQDARIVLLLAYEKLARWKDASSLAMESDKLTLFQNNRAVLKLVWARALREQGEQLGAKTALDEALPYLDQTGTDDASQAFFADPDQDLWGRYHTTSILLRESECTGLSPHETAAKLPAKKKPPKKLATPTRLYGPWLEAVTTCQRQALAEASDDLFSRESPWEPQAAAALATGFRVFGERILGYLHDETARLDRQRALQKIARENIYLLLHAVEEKLKVYKNQELNQSSLESLRKQLDGLLGKISSP
jgi:hypothetical protein